MSLQNTLENRPDLQTERLTLRRPAQGDIPAIVAIVGQKSVAENLARVPHPYGAEDAQFFLEQVVPAEWVWAITISDEDKLIGAVGLTPEADADTAELGYWIDPAHWGMGIATEASREVLAYGFDTLGFPRIVSGYFESNPASGKVLRKLGFLETGQVMRPCLAAGGEVPSVSMELLGIGGP